jgi:hypothetical protein
MDRATMTLRFLAAPTDAGYPGTSAPGGCLNGSTRRAMPAPWPGGAPTV